MNENVTTCTEVNGSLNKKTPSKNMRVGAIYCKNPIRESGIRLAPWANNSKGIAVTAPVPNNTNPSKEKDSELLPLNVNVAI